MSDRTAQLSESPTHLVDRGLSHGWNLLYCNYNPNTDTICSDCEIWIDEIFEPHNAPPLPMHPNCFCVYRPIQAEPTWPPEGKTWADWFEYLRNIHPTRYRRWVQRAAWYLRKLWPLGVMECLREAAERYNEEEYEPRDDDDDDDDDDHETPKETSMALIHNSHTTDGEPAWSDVDKSRLPDAAFADREGRRFPHHWVRNGGDPNADGRYTAGTMYLHKGGLNAAWAAAQGARSGQKAGSAIQSHLQAHRNALGASHRDKQGNSPSFSQKSAQNASPDVDIDPKKKQTASQHTTATIAQGHVILEPASAHEGPAYDAILVQPGWIRQDDGSDSDWLIPTPVLQSAVDQGLFSALPHYVDHPDQFGFGWHQRPSVRDLAGVATNAQWDPDANGVRATIRLYDTEAGQLLRTLYDQIIADKAAGKDVPPIGLSITCYRDYELDEAGAARVWTSIKKVSSVDAVYEPGAAGYIRQALSTVQPDCSHPLRPDPYAEPTISYPTGGTMTEEIIIQEQEPQHNTPADTIDTNTPAESNPDPAPPVTDSPPPWDPDYIRQNLDTLKSALDRINDRLARQEEKTTIHGLGDPPRSPTLYGGLSGLDQVQLAVEALVSGTRPPHGVRPLSGIRELYMLLSGDYDLTGQFHEDRVYLANVTTSTMAGIVANALNKVVINMFQQYDQWWAPGTTIRDFNSLQDVRWITLGGVGELPTVAEGAAYTEMTWDDQTETDSFIKKGGYLGITLETIDKDDTGRVMAAPRALAQAAWLTLGKAIAAVFTANSGYGQAMSDSNYLFDSSNHSNEGSTALSYSAWEATKIAMMKFTELNSGERLGALTRPRYLWVPIDLENTAIEILAAGEGEPDDADYHVNPDALADGLTARTTAARRRVITVPFWTDTNDWVAQADPNMYPGLGLAFRYGRSPEIFSVADPRAGLMFTNDTMPIKVRFFFAVGPTDWRAWYKHIVS